MGLIPFRIAGQPPSSDIMAAPRARPVPVTELLIFPNTEEEYKIVMEEVTRLYQLRRFKQCSARCIQILDNIKDPFRVHPLYSIYLSFYAASSLELTARSLHLNSSQKAPVFQKSLMYYQKAESYMDYATMSADPYSTDALPRRRSSVSSSIRSSVESIFSRSPSPGSANSSALSSPTTSIYGAFPESAHTRNLSSTSTASTSSFTTTTSSLTSAKGLSPAPLRVKKKVSFSDSISSDADRLSYRDSLILDCFPSPPTSPSSHVTQFRPISICQPPPPRPTSILSVPQPQRETDSITSFLFERSLSRYLSTLTGLHAQLHHHIASVNAQLHALALSRKERRSNPPNLFDAAVAMPSIDADELRIVTLRARIEKLKAKSWKRERFDPTRYQALCSTALSELGDQ